MVDTRLIRVEIIISNKNRKYHNTNRFPNLPELFFYMRVNFIYFIFKAIEIKCIEKIMLKIDLLTKV